MRDRLDRALPASAGGPDWNDVGRRAAAKARRRAAGVTLVAVLALAVVGVSTAWAVGAFRGTPAPQGLQTMFSQEDENRVAEVLGVFKQPGVDAARAHGVIQLRTAAGPLRLWAAPVRGGAHCSFIELGDRPSNSPPLGVTTCENEVPPASAPAIEAGVDPLPPGLERPSIRALHGWIRLGQAGTLFARLSDGSVERIPVVEHYFLFAVPDGKRVSLLTFRGPEGRAVARMAPVEAEPPTATEHPIRATRHGPKLIQLRLTNGWTATLYAKPRIGPCYDVEVRDPGGGTESAGECGYRGPPELLSFGLQGFGGGAGPPAGVLLEGYAAPEVDRLELRLRDGETLDVPLDGGYFLFELPKGQPPTELVPHDRSGKALKARPIRF
jgi:hypothetical protein